MKQYAPRVQVVYHGLLSGSKAADITHWFGDNCTIRMSGYSTTLHGMRGEKWSGQSSYLGELNQSGAIA